MARQHTINCFHMAPVNVCPLDDVAVTEESVFIVR